jgi:hypothetical protein
MEVHFPAGPPAAEFARFDRLRKPFPDEKITLPEQRERNCLRAFGNVYLRQNQPCSD